MPHSTQDIDLPDDVHPDLKQVIDDHKLLFARQLGKTMTAENLLIQVMLLLLKHRLVLFSFIIQNELPNSSKTYG